VEKQSIRDLIKQNKKLFSFKKPLKRLCGHLGTPIGSLLICPPSPLRGGLAGWRVWQHTQPVPLQGEATSCLTRQLHLLLPWLVQAGEGEASEAEAEGSGRGRASRSSYPSG
jgi:hypothetical protein